MIYQHVFAAILSALLGFGSGWKVQSWRYGTQIAGIKSDAALAQTKAVRTALSETVRLQGVKDAAIKQAQTRAKANSVALGASRAESLSLRNERAIARASLSGSTCDSVRDYANALSVVFDQCTVAHQELAGKADEHAAGVELVMSAWPK